MPANSGSPSTGVDLVPADVRDPLAGLGHQPPDAAGDQPEPVVEAALLALAGEQLHAEADAEDRLALRRGGAQRVAPAGIVEPVHRLAERADAGHDDRSGIGDRGGIGGDQGLGAALLEAAARRGQIAHAIVDDEDAHLRISRCRN